MHVQVKYPIIVRSLNLSTKSLSSRVRLCHWHRYCRCSGCRLRKFSTFLFGIWSGRNNVLFRFHNRNVVWEWRFGAVLAGWIMRQHNLDFNTKNALSKENVANGSIDILLGGVAAVDHQPVDELHRLGSLPSKFSGNDHLATLGARLHDESQDAIAGASDGQTSDQLVTERLGLSDRAKTASRHLFGVKLDGAIGIVEALLHDGSELTDALAFVAQYVLRTRGENDDFRARRRHAHLDTAVSVFGQLPRQKLVQLRLENSILDELPLLGYLDRHFE